VTVLRALHLDDLRPQVGEQGGGVRPLLPLRKIEDAHAIQWAAHLLLLHRVAPQCAGLGHAATALAACRIRMGKTKFRPTVADAPCRSATKASPRTACRGLRTSRSAQFRARLLSARSQMGSYEHARGGGRWRDESTARWRWWWEAVRRPARPSETAAPPRSYSPARAQESWL